MKILITVTLCLFLFPIISHSTEPSPKISITTGLQSAYVPGRISKEIYDKENMWGEISLEWEHFYLSHIQYEAVHDSWAESATSIGYKWNTHELTFKMQATLINTHPHDAWFDDERLALEFYVSKSFKYVWYGQHTITPELRLGWFSFYDKLNTGVPFSMPAIHHTWSKPFGLEYLTIRNRIGLEIDGGFYKNNRGEFFQFDTGVQWKLNKSCTLTLPGWKLVSPTGKTRDGRDGGSVIFTSLTWTF